MSSNYPYINARIRAMQSELITPADLAMLADGKDADDVARYLAKTAYGPDIEKGLHLYHGAQGVEEGIRKNVLKKFVQIRDMMDEDGKHMIEVWLRKWEIRDIKTILRAQHSGVMDSAVVENLYAVGKLHKSVLAELAKTHDARQLIEMLGSMRSPYTKVLRAALPQYESSRSLFPLEFALDRDYYAELERAATELQSSEDQEIVHAWLINEIHVVNVLLLARLYHETMPLAQKISFFLPLPKRQSTPYADYLNRHSFKEAMMAAAGALKRGAYGEFVAGHVDGSLESLIRGLEKLRIQEQISLFGQDPLSIAIVLAYLYAKHNEGANLRILVYGLKSGLPKSRIESELVYA